MPGLVNRGGKFTTCGWHIRQVGNLAATVLFAAGLLFQVFDEQIKKDSLVRMQQASSFLNRHKTSLIYFPGCTTRSCIFWGRSGKAVNTLTALAVVRVSQG